MVITSHDNNAPSASLHQKAWLENRSPSEEGAMTLHQHHTSDGAEAIVEQSILTANTFTTSSMPPGADTVDGVDLEYRRLFASFGHSADSYFSRKELFSKLHECGILLDDP